LIAVDEARTTQIASRCPEQTSRNHFAVTCKSTPGGFRRPIKISRRPGGPSSSIVVPPTSHGAPTRTARATNRKPLMTPADVPDPDDPPTAANDNSPPGASPEDDERYKAALQRVDRVALKLARIIGRQMAREDFAARMAAANDNARKSSDGDR
jgi:hypothetical protein